MVFLPELPEVETIRRKLNETVCHQTIQAIEIRVPRIIRTPDVDSFLEQLRGQAFTSVERKGKHLVFKLAHGVLVSHLRMEGKFNYTPSSTPYDKHDHVIFHFSNGYDLRYNDVRKFGTMDLVASENEVNSVRLLGPEPLESTLTVTYLYEQFQRKNVTVKQALLNQEIVAGLGNIYVDEVLFYSKIHPEKTTKQLTKKELTLLIEGIRLIIQKAIDTGGSSVRSYTSMGEKGSMQSHHAVYGKTGTPCTRCGTTIIKFKLSGRGTHFCPTCQPK